MWASESGHTEIVKILLEQNRIDINAKDVYLISFMFHSIIQNFKIMIGISSNNLRQPLF